MTERTASETVAQAAEDFDSIKTAIEGHKIDVPYATKTSEYAELIAKIRVGSISGSAECCVNLADTKTLCGAARQELKGGIFSPICGSAVSVPDNNEI